jgi:hypothetical protein
MRLLARLKLNRSQGVALASVTQGGFGSGFDTHAGLGHLPSFLGSQG